MVRGHTRMFGGEPELKPRQVVLTYDDGPGPWTLEMGKWMARHSISATFFALGDSIDRYPDVPRKMHDWGHQLGLHGDDHKPFVLASDANRQLKVAADKMSGLLEKIVYYRPPYGEPYDQAKKKWAIDPADISVPGLNTKGPIGWQAEGEDWKITYREGQTVERCVEMLVACLAEKDYSGIVVLHDYSPARELVKRDIKDEDVKVFEITKMLVDQLRDKNVEYVNFPRE